MALEIFVHVVFKKKAPKHLQTMRRFEFKFKYQQEISMRQHILYVPWIKAVSDFTALGQGSISGVRGGPPKRIKRNGKREKKKEKG